MTGRTPRTRARVSRRRERFRRAAPFILIALAVLLIALVLAAALGVATRRLLLVSLLAGLGLSLVLALTRAFGRTPSGSGRRQLALRSTDDWQQVQDILNGALEVEPGEQSRFVARACAGKPELRSEVISLLAAHHQAGPLDRPAAGLAASPGGAAAGRPSPGHTTGRYEILDRLDSGGMGVVYRARDIRLERTVALKFLPPHLIGDSSGKDRFLVEARAAAALDHPNICTIHEIGETDEGHLFLAMPFYDGETLKQRLARGPLAPAPATEIAIQVAEGLARAHDRGIVHRDIKPANLLVTREGVVKIVDFGIAKLVGVNLTNPGLTPGTVAYMSPEQVRGDEVDGRTDLWSLGVVLYEMLAGNRPFHGDHDGALLHAILTADPPPLRASRPDLSEALEAAVTHALGRNREDRFPDARELVRALEATRAAAGPPTDPRHRESLSSASLPFRDELSSGGARGDGELRQATIVACVLSGYDRLVGRLDPDELERWLGRIRATVSDVAAKYGGTLNRFAGDEIVLLFGIPTTHEDDGIRAARAALELHERLCGLDEADHKREPTLRLHTGIDTGRVIVQAQRSASGDRSYRTTGGAGRTAALLAAHAGADEIWISPECQHLIAPFFETEPQAALTVRDRKQPLIPFRVLGESGARTRLEAAEKAGLTAYTGRAAELGTLQRCLDGAQRGEGQFVTITGEAGIGKSRLLHEFRTTIDVGPVCCLIGRCQADGGTVPYLPFTEILHGLLRVDEPDAGGVLESTLARVREIGSELEDFVPLYLHLLSIPSTSFGVPNHLPGGTLQRAIQEAIAALLTLRARRGPLVVLLEDWHWADEASRGALKRVAELVSGSPLMVIVTSRSGYGVEWGVPGPHVPIPLLPLGPASLVELLKSILHVQSVPDQLGALLHERTGGNPFFLEEICAGLVEDGTIVIEGRTARATGPLHLLELPDSIEAVISARLDRLDPRARDLLRLASVVGREFTRGILESTIADEEDLPETLEALRAAGLIQQTQVVPEAMYRFKHVLTREVAYGSLLEHQRRDLHARVGAQIERLGHDRIERQLDRLAYHFSRAEEWQKALGYGVRSADRASALGQYAEALHILERTQRWLIHLGEGPDRQDVLLGILLRQERLCETLGLRARQQQIIDELIRLVEPDGDSARLAEVYLRQGDLDTLLRRFDKGEQALRRSLEIRRALSDEAGEQKALRSLGLLRWYDDRNDEALACIAQVVAMDRKRNDTVALVGDLARLANVLKTMGQYQQAQLHLEEGIAIADEALAAGSPVAADLRVKQAYILNIQAILAREAGDLDGALALLDRSETIAEVRRLPVYLPYHHVIRGQIALQKGNVEESLDRYGTAVRLAREARYGPGLSQTLRITGEVMLGLNRHAEAIPYLEEAAGLFGQLEDPRTEAHLWTEIATAREAIVDHAGAIAAWSTTRLLFRGLGNAVGELEALEGLAGATRRHGTEPSRALHLYNEALLLAEALGDSGAEGRLRNTLGILEWSRGEYMRALQHYERGFALFDDLEDAPSAGLMLNSMAATLRDLGRVAEAQSRFEQAVAVHQNSGQRQLEGHALAALGDISLELGHTGIAVDYYERSLAIRRAIGDRRGEGWMLYNLARTAGPGRRAAELAAYASEFAGDCDDPELVTCCEQLRRTSNE